MDEVTSFADVTVIDRPQKFDKSVSLAIRKARAKESVPKDTNKMSPD